MESALTRTLETFQKSSAGKRVADSSFAADAYQSMSSSRTNCGLYIEWQCGNRISSIENKITVVIRYSAVKR